MKDGETVSVKLKDRKQKQDEDCIEWYERAFGPKQNMMNIKMRFNPLTPAFANGKVDVYISLKYKMFEEMGKEFKSDDFPSTVRYLVPSTINTAGTYEYEFEKDLPYGTVEIDVSWDNKGKGESDLDLKQIPEAEKPLLDIVQEPENPMSMEELKILHTKEEEDNKKREQEARLAQKRLEEEKARLRYEQQQQIAKQE